MIRNSISSKPFSLLSGKNSSSNPPRLLLLHISSFSTFLHNSGGGAATSYPSRRHEEESRNVRVSVWWDFENCNLPVGANVFKVAQSITAAVRANGIRGPIQITAFGDVAQMSRQNQEALSSTGIYLNHTPRGGKNSADRSLLVDLMYWVSHNPPPAHLFLISGDRDFASTLHRLRMNNYNILLASTDNAPGVLCSAASIMWQWSSIVKGENLFGKHFNQPPDGPYGSWYGHYKAQLEDPFAVLEQPTCPPRVPGTDQSVCLRLSAEPSKCSQPENLTDFVSENKVQSIPGVVVKEITNILSQYPKGVSITELRAELSRSCLTIDKEFYGHKKFSKFLLAMPQVLKCQSRNDGQFFVRGVTPKVPDQVDLITGSSASKGPVNNDGVDSTVVEKLNGRRSGSNDQDAKSLPPLPDQVDLITGTSASKGPVNNDGVDSSVVAELNGRRSGSNDQDAKSLPPSGKQLDNTGNSQDNSVTIQKPTGICADPKVKNASTHLQLSKAESEKTEPPVLDVDDAGGTATQLHNLEPSPVTELGFFKNIWRKWFGREECGSQGKFSDSRDINSDELKSKGKDVTSTLQSVKLVGKDSSSSNSDEANLVYDDGISRISQPSDEEMKTQGSGSFGQFLRTLFWGSSAEADDAGKLDGETNLVEVASTKNEKFGEKSFWDELNSFLRTPEAAAIVKHSKTRMQMGHDLQKQGPPIFSSLSEADLLHLMELIIFDKKWILESSSKSCPFKLVFTDEKGTSNQPSNACRQSNGLSAIFTKTMPTSGSEISGSVVEQKRHAPDADVSEPVRARVSSCKSRNEILADCEKLLVEIVRKYPEGFNMGSFRRVFSERYNYSLDIQKLGYQKLATLLQIMPGVRIESTYILPAGVNLGKSTCTNPRGQSDQETDNNKMKVHSRSSSSDAFGKEEDPWEELGPVDDSNSKKKDVNGLAKNRSFKDETGQKLDPGYESLSDDCLTDSEENSESTQDSSLLQILDSWYSTKDDNVKKGASKNLDIEADSSVNNGSGVSSIARSSTISDRSMMNGSSVPLGTCDKIGMMMNGSRKARTLQRSYSFVQDKGIENNDKLIDGILGSLKKSGEKSAETRI